MNDFVQKGACKSGCFEKCLLFFILMCVQVGEMLHAQTTSTMRLTVTTTAAQCQADGSITCTLSDTIGEQLEQVKYYYIPLSGADSITETSQSTITHLRPGPYKVKVTAVKPTGLSMGGAYVIVTDSIETEVSSSYEIPVAGALYNIFSFSAPYGIVPSFSCLPTGKIQLHIKDGTFPYTATVWKLEGTDSILWRTITFDTNLYSGSDNHRYDYKDYYTIDSLTAGKYRIICNDGCGYYMPAIQITVPKIRHNTQSGYHLIRNSSGIVRSNNIVTLKTLYNDKFIAPDLSNDDYYHYMGHGQSMYAYRFINPTLCERKDTTDWLPLPTATGTAQEVVYYDTVTHIQNYAQLWGEQIQLQVKPILCDDTLFTYTFYISMPNTIFNSVLYTIDSLFSSSTRYDSCGYYSGNNYISRHISDVIFGHKSYSCISPLSCKMPDNYSAAMVSGSSSNQHTHFYYTFPLHYRWFNLTADTLILTDTLKQYHYNWNVRIPFDKKLNGDSLLIEITDALDCPYYSKVLVLDSTQNVLNSPSRAFPAKWFCTAVDSGRYCPNDKRMLAAYQTNGADYYTTHGYYKGSTLLGDTVKLIAGPRGNQHNFTAVYQGNQQWQIIERTVAGTGTIHYDRYYLYNGHHGFPGFIYEDIDLSDGTYVWAFYRHCKDAWDTLVYNADFYDLPTVSESPSYEFHTECSELDIIPVGGQYADNGHNVNTYFQICQGDFEYSPAGAVRQGDTLRLGVPGRYTLSMYTLPKGNNNLLAQNPCARQDTVIIWDGETIRFDYLYAYVCNSGDSIGFVRAKGKNGKTPYQYTLYNEPDGHGTILGQNQTGIFNHIPAWLGKKMSIEMHDDCHAHFITNFTISDMEHTRKGWAEDDLNSLSLCEGATCHFYGLSLGEVTYHWTGPDGFNSITQNPTLFLPRNTAAEGTYYISIEGTGCSTLQDSIRLVILEAPNVTVARDTTVCEGQEVPVTTLVTGVGDISYQLQREDFSSKKVFDFLSRSNGSRDTLTDTPFHNPTLYSILSIQDARCHYTIPDARTVSVMVKPSLEVQLVADTAGIHDSLRAVAHGGSQDYLYQWEQSIDSLTWDTRTDNTAAINLDTSTASARYYRVTVSDRKIDVCPATSIHTRPDLSYINLLLYFSAIPDSICPEAQEVEMVVHNKGNRAAENIKIIQGSRSCSSFYVDTIHIASLGADDSVKIIRTHTFSGQDSSYNMLLQAQIADCAQLNKPDTVIFGDWDWEGRPRQQDEDEIVCTVLAQPRDTIYAQLHDGDIFTFRDSTTLPLSTGSHTAQWFFKNENGCDSLITVMLTVEDLPPCPDAIDYEGNRYNGIRIGTLCWTQKNLISRYYSDGRQIPDVMIYHADLFPDALENERIFGLLYSWQAAADTINHNMAHHRTQGICPQGWFLPSSSDYENLLDYGDPALRVAAYWINNSGGNNSTGFSALPAGFYNGITHRFENMLGETRFWSTNSDSNAAFSYCTYLHYFCTAVKYDQYTHENGYSVRCVWQN